MANDNLRPALWTRDYVLAFISNMLLFFSFYMLMPVLPFYLTQQMGASNSVAGIVLSLYTISALLIRPFSGFFVDMFARKPLYLICYGVFCAIFAGYTVAATLTLFAIMRIMHGFAFGMSTVSGSTVAVDVMNPARRGEGIGYYGMAANIAMATGPVIGLWINGHYTFDTLFFTSFATSLLGWFVITRIRPIVKERPQPGTKQPLSLDRFILVRALPCIGFLFMGGIGYGSMLNYVGLYSEELSHAGSSGLFFVLLAAGIVSARLISARAVNKGKIVPMICTGASILIAAFFLLSQCRTSVMLDITAFLLGVGFGYISPAFQTMFINLAEHNRRGTANATYFTAWDLGIGSGTALGGIIIENIGFRWLYAICGGAIAVGALYFFFVSAPWYERYKLR